MGLSHHCRRYFRVKGRRRHVALVVGFARGRRPCRDRSCLLDSQQPDECRTARFASPSARHPRAGSRPYCAERRALAAAALTCAPARSGCAARSNSGARCRTAGGLAPCSRPVPRDAPGCRRSSRRSLRPRLLPDRSLTRPYRRPRRDGRRSRKSRTYMRPRASRSWSGPGPIPRPRMPATLPAARRRLGLSAAGGQVRPSRDCQVAEEDRSAFRHLPDRWRLSSGRRAQGERRMPGFD